MKKLVKDLKNFPKNPYTKGTMAWDIFNEARELIGNLQQGKQLDKKHLWAIERLIMHTDVSLHGGALTDAYHDSKEALEYLKSINSPARTNEGTGKQDSNVSPHKLYEMAKGDTQKYKELMLAHGYLIPKKIDGIIVNPQKILGTPSLGTKEVDENKLVEFLSEQCNCDMNLDCDRRELAKAISAFLRGDV